MLFINYRVVVECADVQSTKADELAKKGMAARRP
jgi:hypothetical protein